MPGHCCCVALKREDAMETQAGFIRSVHPLPKHKSEVVMETDTHTVSDFTWRLCTM